MKAVHKMADYPTAPCSVCARMMRVKKDGTIGHHGGEKGKGWMGNREYTCRGVGKPPAPVGGQGGAGAD